jgi:hypothetical protein
MGSHVVPRRYSQWNAMGEVSGEWQVGERKTPHPAYGHPLPTSGARDEMDRLAPWSMAHR